MNGLIEWLLGLEGIRLGRDAPLLLEWQNPFAAWQLFGFALGALSLIAFVYHREHGSLGRRLCLGTLRGGLVALVAVVICQPALVLQQNRVEASHVALAFDSSMSMSMSDSYVDQRMAQRIARGAGLGDPDELVERSRLELVKAAILRNDAGPLRALLMRNAVRLSSFAGSVEARGYFASPSSLNGLVDAVRSLPADGATTDLAGAIRHVIDKSQGRRLAAIVLLTDGQATQPTNLDEALGLAQGRQIPIYPIRIGSPLRPLDIEVELARVQERVFRNDMVAVEARVRGSGLTEETTVTLQLIDERTNTVAAEEQVVLRVSEPTRVVELRTKAPEPGHVRYRVEALALASESTLENNVRRVDVTVLDDRLRVLYVDGYPRYEYRYLKNALLREETMDLSVLLIDADEKFVQEGTDPIRRFPVTPEELHRYDVVLMGDVDPQGGWLTVAQMNMLLDFVGNRGGGFGLIAGERFTPHRFLATPLRKLIPVRIDPGAVGDVGGESVVGFKPRLTADGYRSGLFRFALDREESERLFAQLPELYWFARTLGPKPGASVLAEHPTIRSGAGPMPIVVTGRYGAGMLFFQATDDTWRWRRHTGELLHDTYWVQVVRELMRGSRVAANRRFVVRTDRRTYSYGSAVRCQVEVMDPTLLAEQGGEVRILVTQPRRSVISSPGGRAESGLRSAQTVTSDAPTTTGSRAVAGRFVAYALGPDANVFEGTWVPPRPGDYLIEAADLAPGPGEDPVLVPVRVERPDLEGRRVEADHETLEHIASATGGRVIELDELEKVFGEIRDRSVRIPDDIVEPLWDSKLVLGLFVLMISMEWVLRKAFGLL